MRNFSSIKELFNAMHSQKEFITERIFYEIIPFSNIESVFDKNYSKETHLKFKLLDDAIESFLAKPRSILTKNTRFFKEKEKKSIILQRVLGYNFSSKILDAGMIEKIKDAIKFPRTFTINNLGKINFLE